MPATRVPMRFPDVPLLWTVHRVFNAAECRERIRRIEAWGPELATNNPMYRDQDRVMRDDPTESARLLDRLRPHLPERIGELRLHSMNVRLRYYRYTPGQRFAAHMDHWYQPNDRQITLLTTLTYFNGGLEGGETRFTEQVDAVVEPEAGLCAIFQHKIRHEGRPVVRGTKYAMRADVIYEAPSPIELTLREST